MKIEKQNTNLNDCTKVAPEGEFKAHTCENCEYVGFYNNQECCCFDYLIEAIPKERTCKDFKLNNLQICECGHPIDDHVPDMECSKCECRYYSLQTCMHCGKPLIEHYSGNHCYFNETGLRFKSNSHPSQSEVKGDDNSFQKKSFVLSSTSGTNLTKIMEIIDNDRDNGNIEDGGFSPAICLSKVIKFIESQQIKTSKVGLVDEKQGSLDTTRIYDEKLELGSAEMPKNKSSETLEKDGQGFGSVKPEMGSEWSSTNSKAEKLMGGCERKFRCKRWQKPTLTKPDYYITVIRCGNNLAYTLCPSCQRAKDQYKEDLEEELERWLKVQGVLLHSKITSSLAEINISYIKNELKILEGK